MPRLLHRDPSDQCLYAFPTALGWMAIRGCQGRLLALAFGHRSARAALRACGPWRRPAPPCCDWNPGLVRKLCSYAAGRPIDFRDTPVDLQTCTEFQRRVLEACRTIPWGQTWTYAQLAAAAGYPGAARAVGQCMAANPIPLVIPCHRVVGSDGRLRGYSGPGGLAMKLRLLQLESAPS